MPELPEVETILIIFLVFDILFYIILKGEISMKEYGHDELRAKININKKLKKKSDQAHKFPENSLDDAMKNKLLMIEIFAEVVGCKNMDSAKESIKEVIGYIKKHSDCNSIIEWKESPDYKEQIKEIRKIGKSFLSAKKCCSPNGGDYVCFCSQKRR